MGLYIKPGRRTQFHEKTYKRLSHGCTEYGCGIAVKWMMYAERCRTGYNVKVSS